MKRLIPVFFLIVMLIPIPISGQATPTDLEIEVHRLVNEVREDRNHGGELAPLLLASVLVEVARKHSQDMADNNYFAHENPDEDNVGDRVSDAGIDYSSVGENLARNSYDEDETAAVAVEGWINSPGHYANMLGSWKYTGIGIAKSGDQYYITQVFLNGDPAQLENKGQIYDNDQLDDIPEDTGGFRITANMAGAAIVILVVLIGIDANRRNKQYYRRR